MTREEARKAVDEMVAQSTTTTREGRGVPIVDWQGVVRYFAEALYRASNEGVGDDEG